MKVALVTGGGSGIGLATSLILVDRGYKVVRVDKVLDFIITTGAGRIYDFICDLSRRNEIVRLFKLLSKEFKRLDFLVINAGVHCAKSITTASDEDFDYSVAVNLAAPFYCMKYALPLIVRQGGSIVSVGSDVYSLPDKDAPLYTATKTGMVALTRAAALEWGAKGVRINAVCPGATDTPFLRNAFGNDAEAVEACRNLNPLRRIATPEEIAKVIVFVGLDATFVNGAAWPVDGGYTVQGGAEPPKI